MTDLNEEKIQVGGQGGANEIAEYRHLINKTDYIHLCIIYQIK